MDNKSNLLRLIGNILDSEISLGETSDMEFIRKCIAIVEEHFPQLTKDELEAILREILEDKRGGE
jgi:hypothetical protein